MPVFRCYHFIASPLFFQHPAPEHLPSKSAYVCAFHIPASSSRRSRSNSPRLSPSRSLARMSATPSR